MLGGPSARACVKNVNNTDVGVLINSRIQFGVTPFSLENSVQTFIMLG